MVNTNDFECDVCHKVTRIKHEVASDSCRYHVYVPCKNCKTMFYGTYNQCDDNVSVSIHYLNAKKVDNAMPDYVCTITSDFISEKVKDVSEKEDIITLPMWMKFKNVLVFDNYLELFKTRVPVLLDIYSTTRHEWEKVVELWINGENYYLDKELKSIFEEYQEVNNIGKEKRLSLIRRLAVTVFSALYSNDDYKKKFDKIKKEFGEICRNNPKRLKDFLDEMSKENRFENLEKLLYLQMKRSLDFIPNLIPILSVEYLDDATKQILFDEQSPLGIYSFDFDEIKKLYQDLYETHAKTIYVLVGLDNLSIRKDFNKFDVGCKYTSLKKYIAEDRAFYKIDAIDKNSIFAFNLKKFMNNHLRNMIGHCSYEINNITQIVKYKNGQKTLVEITYYCYQLILELLNSFCIVTLLHELYLSDSLDK